ncbi:MAG: carbon monoxide dehydrogenase subunit G [Pseudomonadota bacterium]|uniref:CoxG family protein n=1 Tax=Hydrogenophaga sp. TaxID=1904254 RepID=UPI0027217A41|nr:carbon monoxide dehydrogenase subunit G [Hydrogenophaga sp.]MDO9505500.1 carbon monoxide dehydrogenase subunit G [Hydrogenophaga sp.]MDZ4146211.1 carbon monoxide dehydrogenase subunit G [Burkholderiales bacterium]MDZ4357558.1 carbon monoxide dehydrogenase subunit G [Variovorax sp.]
MDMQGTRQLAVTQQQAWEALNNPEILKTCIPGCEKFELTGENTYAVGTAIKIGPVAARFSGRVVLSDILPPQSYKLGFDAQGGVAGFGKGESSVTLKPSGTGCELSYTVHSTVGGKIAQLGQRLIDGAAKSLAEDFFRRFEEELQRRYPAAAGEVVALPAPTTSGGLPAWVWGTIAVLVAAAVYLATRG